MPSSASGESPVKKFAIAADEVDALIAAAVAETSTVGRGGSGIGDTGSGGIQQQDGEIGALLRQYVVLHTHTCVRSWPAVVF